MGEELAREQFTDDDHRRFLVRLDENLQALRELVARPSFGAGPPSIGAELELFLVDEAGRPLPRNRDLLALARDPRLTVETNRCNLEVNATPVPLAGRCFGALGRELDEAVGVARRAARRVGGDALPIGILPTLEHEDLVGAAAVTDLPRYRALATAIQRLRRQPCEIHIRGVDEVHARCDDAAFEGAATSLQVHLRVPPARFAAHHDAAQLVTAPVLAAAGNSPLFLGRRLWDETRIALLAQANDERTDPWQLPRVSFGTGWSRRGLVEHFEESVALHPPLLPVCSEERPLERVRAGHVPRLDELRTHHGTVWRWNRAVYDWRDGGHVRIEFRALPAGPSTIDMLANAAFLVGATLHLAPKAERLVSRITFDQATRNFFEAARVGLDAELLWPADVPPSPRAVTARDLVLALLPGARDGLVRAGVDAGEADALLDVVARRTRRGTTGARWLVERLEGLGGARGGPAARSALVRAYAACSRSGRGVHAWPLDRRGGT